MSARAAWVISLRQTLAVSGQKRTLQLWGSLTNFEKTASSMIPHLSASFISKVHLEKCSCVFFLGGGRVRLVVLPELRRIPFVISEKVEELAQHLHARHLGSTLGVVLWQEDRRCV